MTLMGGSELTAGLAVLVLATLVTAWLRRRGRTAEDPSALFLSIVPVSVLLLFVLGFMLIMHGFRVV